MSIGGSTEDETNEQLEETSFQERPSFQKDHGQRGFRSITADAVLNPLKQLGFLGYEARKMIVRCHVY